MARTATAPAAPKVFVEDHRLIGAEVDIDGNSGLAVSVKFTPDYLPTLRLQRFGAGALDATVEIPVEHTGALIAALSAVRDRVAMEQKARD